MRFFRRHLKDPRCSFLNDEERASFTQSDRRISRRVATHSPVSSIPINLTEAVQHDIDPIAKAERDRFRCCCISVPSDDGMSWSAESVATMLADRFPQYTRWYLGGTPQMQQLPEITQIVGERALFRLATAHKLIRGFFRSFNPLARPLMLGLALLVAMIERVVERISDQPVAHTLQEIVVSFIDDRRAQAAAVVSFFLFLLLHLMMRWFETGDDSDGVKKLIDVLDFSRNTPEFDKLTAGLALSLKRGQFPRAIVVNNYESLDHTTKAVLRRYLRGLGSSDPAEVWVVFENPQGERLSSLMLAEGAPLIAAESKLSLYEQLPITAEEQKLLPRREKSEAGANGQPIKLLCADVGEKKHLRESFDEWRSEHPKRESYDDLDFLYFLSLTSGPCKLLIPRTFLSTKFLEGKDQLQTRILKEILSGTRLESLEIDSAFKTIIAAFPKALLLGEGGKTLWVYPDAAAVLEEHAGGLRLPPANEHLGHPFWCFFWRDICPGTDIEPFSLRKIVYHLTKAVKIAGSDEVHARMIERLLDIGLFAVGKTLENLHVR